MTCTVSLAAEYGKYDPQKEEERRIREDTKAARRITPEEAYLMYKTGKAFLISVDDAPYFKQYRILGTINIPWDKFEKGEFKLPKHQPIILYCH